MPGKPGWCAVFQSTLPRRSDRKYTQSSYVHLQILLQILQNHTTISFRCCQLQQKDHKFSVRISLHFYVHF